MKKMSVLILAVAVTCTAASAYLGQVISSMRCMGGDRCHGIVRSALYMYETSSGSILRCNPENGYIISSFLNPGETHLSALTYSANPDYLWICSRASTDRVFWCHPTTGSVYGSWPITYPSPGITAYCTGDGGVGMSYIITHDRYVNRFLYCVPTTGSIIRSASYAHGSLFDCAYDWRNEVIWMGTTTSSIVYAYDSSTGSVRDSFPSPMPTPQAITYYGPYLYIYCNYFPYLIYKVHCPQGMSGVTPSSVGRIKVLFR